MDAVEDVSTVDEVTRVSGSDRYATSVAVATFGVDEMGLTWDGVALATGEDFPDALSGGVMQGMQGAVMVLTPTSSLAPVVKSKLADMKAEIGMVKYLGGTGAVSQTVRNAVEALF
jgi:putative cell wall-binding protein